MSCWRRLATGAIDCERIIDPIVRFDEAPSAYEEYVDWKPAAERQARLRPCLRAQFRCAGNETSGKVSPGSPLSRAGGISQQERCMARYQEVLAGAMVWATPDPL